MNLKSQISFESLRHGGDGSKYAMLFYHYILSIYRTLPGDQGPVGFWPMGQTALQSGMMIL